MAVVAQYVPKDPAPIQQQDGSYVSDNGEIKATFGQDAQGQHVVEFEARGYKLHWIPREIKYIDPATQLEDIIVSANQTSPLFVLRDYHARYDRHFPDVEEWFRVEGGKLKHYFSLRGDQRPPLPILQDPYLAVSGVLEYDPSLSVRGPLGMTMAGAFQSSDPISLVDADGREIFTFPAIAAWDQSSPAHVQRGMFFVEEIGEGRLSFSVGVPYSWLSQPDVMYPVVIDPTVVVASAYDISGPGGRKIVRLSNGWIVVAAYRSNNGIYYYVSKDNGQTWAQLCYATDGGSGGFAIASSGTVVYTISINPGTATNFFIKFDAATVTNSRQNSTNIDTQQSAYGPGCSLAIDGTGTLHAAWCSKNSTYPNSFNIRYSKSTDGVTWATPTQVTTHNTSGYDHQNPCLVVTPDNIPHIFHQYTNGGSTYFIKCNNWNGSSWSDTDVYYKSSTNQSNPCAVVDSSGRIHVFWTYANTAIYHSVSSDGGSSWSAPETVYSATSVGASSVAYDPSHSLFYVFLTAWTTTAVYYVVGTTGSWGSPQIIDNGTAVQSLWSEFNANSSDAIRYMYCTGSSIDYGAITLNSPPNAPILTQHANFDATMAQTFQWTFSDPNQGDSQSAFQLQIVDVGTGQTVVDTGKVAGTSQSYTLPAGTLQNGKQYQWRVTTWDQQNAQSPWSSYSTFETAAAPSVSITSPAAGGTVATSSVTAQWSYSDPAGNQQATYQVILQDANNVILWDSGQQTDSQGNARALTVGYTLANNTTYKLVVNVTNAKGIQATSATVTFSTSFTPPAVPTVTATPQNGFIRLAVTNPTPSGSQPTVAYNDIYRREAGDSTWTRIATGLPNNGTYDDYAVASGKQYQYKVTAVGNNGTSSDSDVASASITLSGVWLHDPLDPAGTVRQFLLREQQRTLQTQYAQTMMQFEGRSLPVADIAGQKTQQVQVTIQCPANSGDLDALYSLIGRQTTLLYRDNRGRKIYGVVSAVPETEDYWGSSVQLTVQAVSYEEAV